MGSGTVPVPHGACFFCLKMMRPVDAEITAEKIVIHAACENCPPMPARFLFYYRTNDPQAIGQLWEIGWWRIVELWVKRVISRVRRTYRAFLGTGGKR